MSDKGIIPKRRRFLGGVFLAANKFSPAAREALVLPGLDGEFTFV
jgi:hypothetical protein